LSLGERHLGAAGDKCRPRGKQNAINERTAVGERRWCGCREKQKNGRTAAREIRLRDWREKSGLWERQMSAGEKNL
jgi:hypothetical protein